MKEGLNRSQKSCILSLVVNICPNIQACDGFLLSFILTTFLAHSFFSYFLTTFLCNSFFLTTFLQKYIFSSFEGQKLVISRQKNSRYAGPFFLLYCAKIVRFILTTFLKFFRFYCMACRNIAVPGYGYQDMDIIILQDIYLWYPLSCVTRAKNISVCHLVIIHFGGYFFFAGEYIFCLYDVRIPIFSYFLTTFSS